MDIFLILALRPKSCNMRHITKEQRYTIETLLSKGKTRSFIANIIGKDKSVISREINRNKDKRNGKYKANLAQKKYEQRKAEKPHKVVFTSKIKEYVEEKIKDDLSPEQIYGKAKIEGIKCVSHETIYQYIWQDKKQGGNLHEHLRRHGRKYRKRGNLKDSRGIIKNRVSIDDRPKIVDDKSRFGDLEIDTIIGKNHKGAILTINDRWSSFVWIRKLNGKNAKELAIETVNVLKKINNLIHTITGDNGKEFAKHEIIAEQLNIDFFFAHPYHSWERGANENTNGLIRQYVPKGSYFEDVTQEYLNYIQNKLNNRPRKRLAFLSPIEFLTKFEVLINNNKVAFAA